MRKDIELFEDIIDDIVNVEEITVDDENAIHKYTLKDGTTYEVPFPKIFDLESLLKEVTERPRFTMPSSEYGIEKMCRDMLTRMRIHLHLKELYRYMVVTEKIKGNDIGYLNIIKEVLETSQTYIKYNADLAATLVPLWFGRDIPGLPHYYGGNPYNIHGVDHKYDYLLKENEQYLKMERDIILFMAISKKPYIPTEIEIYNSSKLSNITQAKLDSEVPTK